MANTKVTFGSLVTRAEYYLTSAAEQSKSDKIDSVLALKDRFGYTDFLVDLGKAIPDLRPDQQSTLCRMVGCIDRVMVEIAKEEFRRKYKYSD